jgi:hypothetical protein
MTTNFLTEAAKEILLEKLVEANGAYRPELLIKVKYDDEQRALIIQLEWEDNASFEEPYTLNFMIRAYSGTKLRPLAEIEAEMSGIISVLIIKLEKEYESILIDKANGVTTH